MPADRKASSNGFDEGLLKMEVTATNIARAVDQKCNISGNRDVGDTCNKKMDDTSSTAMDCCFSLSAFSRDCVMYIL